MNDAGELTEQLRAFLPAEGHLTQRLAELRSRAHRAKRGHIGRIEEVQAAIARMAPQERRRAAQELEVRYGQLKLDVRMERLDGAVAANERRIIGRSPAICA